MMEDLFWIVLTCVLTPVSSLICCWMGLWFQKLLGIDNE